MIAARPSRMSSPVNRSSSVSLMIFLSIAHRLTTLVSAARKPSSWVPPSMRVDRVGEGVDALGVGRVPLHRDLDRQPVARGPRRRSRSTVLWIGVLGRVQVPDEVGDAARVVVGDLLRSLARPCGGGGRVVLVDDLLGALVAQHDRQALVEERHLLQPAADRLEGVGRGLEDRVVGPERDGRAGLAGRGALLQRRGRLLVDVGLAPVEAVARRSRPRAGWLSALTTETPTPCRPPETA